MSRLKRIASAKATHEPKAVVFTRNDRLLTIALVSAMMIIALSLFIFEGRIAVTHQLNKRMVQWKATYHLSEEQVTRIRAIEESFHGSGYMYDINHGFSREELHRHHLEISKVMSTEDAAKFLSSDDAKKH
jgi:hypothetical protein